MVDEFGLDFPNIYEDVESADNIGDIVISREEAADLISKLKYDEKAIEAYCQKKIGNDFHCEILGINLDDEKNYAECDQKEFYRERIDRDGQKLVSIPIAVEVNFYTDTVDEVQEGNLYDDEGYFHNKGTNALFYALDDTFTDQIINGYKICYIGMGDDDLEEEDFEQSSHEEDWGFDYEWADGHHYHHVPVTINMCTCSYYGKMYCTLEMTKI